ncbi:hypothetical protein TNCV_3442331 [Trichonephila clavipes]|nr:hypothetical protein TNCV_3442331 [Trichonephila clavipes]
MKASPISPPGEDLMKITLVHFDSSLKRTCLHSCGVHMTDIFNSTISGLTSWMQSNGRTKLDAGHKGQSLQDSCRLLVSKFFFQIQQKGQKNAEEPLSSYIVVRLMLSKSHV